MSSIGSSAAQQPNSASKPYWKSPGRIALATCCVIGPLLLGYLAPNKVADLLMPLEDKSVVKFVLPNLETDSTTKIQKLKNTLADKEKLLTEKQSGSAEEKIKAGAAVEAAKADVEKAEASRESDRTVAQSKLIAETLTARYNYAAISGVLYLVSAATLLLGGLIVYGRSKVLLIVGFVVFFGLAWRVTVTPTAYANAGQTFLRVLLDQADANRDLFMPLFEAYKDTQFKVSTAIRQIVDINTFVGLLAVGVALLAFAALSGSKDEPTFATLERRKTDLQRMIVFSSAILVVATVASKVVMDWPLTLIVASQAEVLKPLANALTSHLGITGTIALLAAAAPAWVGWRLDVESYLGTPPDPQKKQEADKLAFAMPSTMASVVAVLAPALTSPIFASLKALIDFVAAGKGAG